MNNFFDFQLNFFFAIMNSFLINNFYWFDHTRFFQLIALPNFSINYNLLNQSFFQQKHYFLNKSKFFSSKVKAKFYFMKDFASYEQVQMLNFNFLFSNKHF